jgi:cytochrome c oxidase subunit 3
MLKQHTIKLLNPYYGLVLLSIVMMFAGLTSAYVVRADNGNWLLFNLPNAFYLSTAVIVTSSITLFFALQMAKKDNKKGVIIGLLVTFALGLLFSYCQYSGWGELYSKNIVFGGKSSNAAGSFFI